MSDNSGFFTRKKLFLFLKSVLAIFIFAWFLNFAWESFHGPFLYRMGEHLGIATHQKFVPLIAWVSVKDAALVAIFYGIIGIIYKNLLWVREAHLKHLSSLMLLGIVAAAGIEYHALATGRWVYSGLMPLVAGIGISPLLQLGVTGALSVWLTHWLLYRKIS